MTPVRGEGDRSVAIEGDAHGTIIVTGDHNRVFAGNQIQLDDARIDPVSVYERVGLNRFVGREWLNAQVDAMLTEQDRGLLILEAGAGLGKTAYLAHLASSRGWIQHFVETSRGAGGVARGVQNLCAQLIERYEIEPYTSDGVLPAAAGSPESLSSLLFAAARSRDARVPQDPIVLIVDALDESAPVESHNVMGLPKVLPRGVYLVCSQRPVPVTLSVEGPPPRIVRLSADEPANLVDMREFLRRATVRPAIATALATTGRSAEEFVETLLDRCGGVWIYLQYVIAGIEQGHYTPLDLDALPQGVWRFYAEFWMRGRGAPSWRSFVLPLLGGLAAVQEDTSVAWLCMLVGVTEVDAARDLLEGPWRPFLTIGGRVASERQYRLYHASLREFLDGRVQLDDLTTAQQIVAEELAAATRAAHGRIADRYLGAWGGLTAGLLKLQDSTWRDLDHQYGLRHVIGHLLAGGRLLDANGVLAAEWIREERVPITGAGLGGQLDRLLGRKQFRSDRVHQNAWFAAKGGTADFVAYLADQQRTWRAAEMESLRAASDGQPASTVTIEVRCALAVASLNDVAGNVGPRLLEALVQREVIAPSLAFAYAQQSPDDDQRLQALLRVAPFLDDPDRTEAYRSALSMLLRLLPDRTPELPGDLRQVLPDWVGREILAALPTAALHRSFVIGPALAQLAPVVSAQLLEEIVRIAQGLGKDGVAPLVAAFARSSPPLREAVFKQVRDSAKQAGRQLPTEAIAPLLSIAAHLPPDMRSVVIDRARDQLTREWRDWARLLVAAVEPAGRCEVAEQIVEAALHRKVPEAVRVCGPILGQLSERTKQVFDAFVRSTNDNSGASAMAVFEAERLAKSGHFDQALATVDLHDRRPGTPYSPYHHAAAIAAIAPIVPASLIPAVLERACAVSHTQQRRSALDALASRLGLQELKTALAATTRIGDRFLAEQVQVKASVSLAPLLRSARLADWALNSAWMPGERLAAVAASLPAEALQSSVTRAQMLRAREDRAKALIALAAAGASVPAKLVREALDALSHTGHQQRAEVLARLLGDRQLGARLPAADRCRAFRWLMADLAALNIQAGWQWVTREALENCAASFTERELRMALQMTGAIPDSRAAAEVFKLLAPYLPERSVRVLGGRGSSLGSARWGQTQTNRNRWLDRWLPGGTPTGSTFANTLGFASLTAMFRQSAGEQAASLLQTLRTTPEDHTAHERTALAIALVDDLPTRLALQIAFLAHNPDRRSVEWQALSTALALRDAPIRAEALEALGDCVDPLAGAALRRASAELRGTASAQKPPPRQSLTEIAALLTQLSRSHRDPDQPAVTDAVPTLSDVVQACIDLHGRSTDALAELVSQLPTDQAETAVAHYVALLPEPRAEYLSELAQALPSILPAPSPALVARVSHELAVIGRHDGRYGTAIATLAEQMPIDALATWWMAPGARESTRERARVLGVLARRLSDAPPVEAHKYWSELLRVAATGQRRTLLMDLGALAPLIGRLGGAEGLEATLEAIVQAEEWWP